MNRGGQFNFVWLFAILVGGAILFLAIYGALKTGDTQRYQTDTQIAKEISVLLNPLQAGFADSSFGSIEFQDETRIRNVCFFSEGDFGKNDISVSTRSEIGQEWNLEGGATSVHNKYIFSSERNTGKTYYVLSKPFNFPYKVTDLTLVTSGNYCFVNAPNSISEEIDNLEIPNLKSENCDFSNAIRVCFGSGSDCDVTVHGNDAEYSTGSVEKSDAVLKYSGNLLYAAIFSEEEIYECNVKRILYRTGKIAEEFAEKTDLMNARGCGTNLKSDLVYWQSSTINAGSGNLYSLQSVADELSKKNDRELCGLW